MSYIIELFVFNLFIFIIRAFNETCGDNKPPCTEPFICTGKSSGFCLCSLDGTTTDEKNPLAFWTGDHCMQCPLNYVTIGTRCYRLISGKDSQLNWTRARTRCQESGGDLAVIRSEKDYKLFSMVLYKNIGDQDMFQRSPINAKNFASVWIGAKLRDWNSIGTFDLVVGGPPITKTNEFWCSQDSLLGQEPNYIGLKNNGERQECLALAVLPDNKPVCMHDWFCSWDTYALCEIYPPPPIDSGLVALGGKLGHLWLYLGIAGAVLLIVSISVGTYCMCRKKKHVSRTESRDSGESSLSEN